MTTALALFSGGLDSIIAARLIMEQGIKVKCLHFYSPFFGQKKASKTWTDEYKLDVECIDVSDDFIQIIKENPKHGFGKVMNPCVDCKILMLTKAKQLLAKYNASFIISGEVLGQRPMSQRRDSLDVISKEADIRDILVRPLSAQNLKPSQVELDGLVDRDKLCKIFGRGRKDQLALAERFDIKTIPTPAGGCKLTEKENAKRYLPVIEHSKGLSNDLYLSNVGRQAWLYLEDKEYWLTIGRKEADNKAIMDLIQEDDYVFKMIDIPGPLALARGGKNWDDKILADAASFVASYAPKAGELAKVRTIDDEKIFEVRPSRVTDLNWGEYTWDETKEKLRARILAEKEMD